MNATTALTLYLLFFGAMCVLIFCALVKWAWKTLFKRKGT